MNAHTIELLWSHWTEPIGWRIRLYGKYGHRIDSIPNGELAQKDDLTDTEAEHMVCHALTQEKRTATPETIALAVRFRVRPNVRVMPWLT